MVSICYNLIHVVTWYLTLGRLDFYLNMVLGVIFKTISMAIPWHISYAMELWLDLCYSMYTLHGTLKNTQLCVLRGDINYTKWVSNLVDKGHGGDINVHRNAWASSLRLGSLIGLDHLQQVYVSFASVLCVGVEVGKVACGGRQVFHTGLTTFVSLVQFGFKSYSLSWFSSMFIGAGFQETGSWIVFIRMPCHTPLWVSPIVQVVELVPPLAWLS